MPSHWKAKPPSKGPIMRVAALVAESSAIAGTIRCGPATSPTMRRRVDISVAHIVPEIRLPSATGHSAQEGAEGELRQLTHRHHEGDGERRARDLVGEQARRQKLQPAHGIGEG